MGWEYFNQKLDMNVDEKPGEKPQGAEKERGRCAKNVNQVTLLHVRYLKCLDYHDDHDDHHDHQDHHDHHGNHSHHGHYGHDGYHGHHFTCSVCHLRSTVQQAGQRGV